MIMIDNENLSSILGKLGTKICTGSEGRKCSRPRRNCGRLCKECHRDYMRKLRSGVKVSGRVREIDGYDFNQEYRDQ